MALNQPIKKGDPLVRINPEEYDARLVAAQPDLSFAEAAVAVARAALALSGVVAANRAALVAGEAQALGALSRAQATLTLARQDQGHAIIRAPIDGVVADRQVEPGDYVQPGARLLTIEPLGRLYVTANFKETQTARMKPGQQVRIKVDALPGRALSGHVESLAPGTGSRFSLLPFEPGTGNFTKIVQRVPVRIAFDAGQSDLARLRPGLSVEATVQLRN